MERSFVLCERPRSCSQRPMEMGCAYNEAQVRVTLFKKWIRRAQSQLGWTQVLQTLLSAPVFPDPASSPLGNAPTRRHEICGFLEREGNRLEINAIKPWRGGFWALVRGHFTKNRPWRGCFSGPSSPPPPGRAWDSAARLIDSNESLYFL